MHDLDRTLRELEWGAGEMEAGDYEFEFGSDPELEAGYDQEMEGEFEWGDGQEMEGEFEFGEELEGEGEFEFGEEMEGEGEFEAGYEGEGEFESGHDGEAVFDEVGEMELAAGLLEVTDEQELDYFIKNLLKKAAQFGRQVLGTPEGKALAGVLKNVARKVVPAAGAALGNLAIPGIGPAAIGQLTSVANQVFGLELEGLSPQDQEFEVARRFVQLAGAAAQEVAQNPGGGRAPDAAKDAVVRAAQRYAPGLAGGASYGMLRRGYGMPRRRYGMARRGYGMPQGTYTMPQSTYDANRGTYDAQGGMGGGWGWARSGRWVRRGRRIILYGV